MYSWEKKKWATKQLQDGSGLAVQAREYKRRDSRATALLFASDPTSTPTPQNGSFEGEATQADPNLEALRLSDAPLNSGETTPECLKDLVGFGFTLDEARAWFAKKAEYTSNPSALKMVNTGSGRWLKAAVMRALKLQFGNKDLWRLLERHRHQTCFRCGG